MSFIELHPWRKTLNFGVEIVKPRFRIDDGPEAALASWTPTRIPVVPGRHHVEMWVHWGLYSSMGRNAVEVDVPPEGLRVSWCSPSTAFSKGKMAVTAPGHPAEATGSVLAEVPSAGATIPAAAWHPDPTGRHQLRYWDGAQWTSHASDDGSAVEDPL